MFRLAAAGATSGVVFAAVVGSVAGMNYVRYGAFTTNEFKSASFLSAYGAISRIRHTEWQRYVVNLAYVSPATPFLIVFVVLGLYLGIVALQDMLSRRRPAREQAGQPTR